MACLEKCTDCIFPYLKGCPVRGSKHNAWCLTYSQEKEDCTLSKCGECKFYKDCKSKIALVNDIIKRCFNK